MKEAVAPTPEALAGWQLFSTGVLLIIEVDLSWEVNFMTIRGCFLGFVEVDPCKDGVLNGLKQEQSSVEF